jgi:hypothetical protein
VTFLLLLAACAGPALEESAKARDESVDPADPNAAATTGGTQDPSGTKTTDATEGDTAASATTVSFAHDVEPVLKAHCSGCHAGRPMAIAPLDQMNFATAESAYASLVNVVSEECGPTMRVAPGSLSGSYLMTKIKGSGPCFAGHPMPIGHPLRPTDIAKVQAWIQGGALND